MPKVDTAPQLQSERLVGVIKAQTEIAKLGLDFAGVMNLVADRARTLTGADGAVVELCDGDEMVYRAAVGTAARQLGLRLSKGSSLSGMSVTRGETLRCDDTETDERVDRDACRRVGLRSMLVVPLKHEASAVGVLKLLSKSPDAFGPADEQLLGLMAELITASMSSNGANSSELFQRATLDSLTGLANRALFFDRLRHCLAQGRRNSHGVGVFVVDFERWKEINEEHGHRAGDAAVCELASRVLQSARTSDTVARLAPNEFGIILSRVDGRDGVEIACHRLAELIERPFVFDDVELRFEAIIGSGLYPEDGESLDMLMSKAEQSLKATKAARGA